MWRPADLRTRRASAARQRFGTAVLELPPLRSPRGCSRLLAMLCIASASSNAVRSLSCRFHQRQSASPFRPRADDPALVKPDCPAVLYALAAMICTAARPGGRLAFDNPLFGHRASVRQVALPCAVVGLGSIISLHHRPPCRGAGASSRRLRVMALRVCLQTRLGTVHDLLAQLILGGALEPRERVDGFA